MDHEALRDKVALAASETDVFALATWMGPGDGNTTWVKLTDVLSKVPELHDKDQLGYHVRSIGCPSDLILLGIFNGKGFYRVDYKNVDLLCDDNIDRDELVNRVLSAHVEDLLLDVLVDDRA